MLGINKKLILEIQTDFRFYFTICIFRLYGLQVSN